MRRKILLADDSPTIQRLVTQTFTDADFEILSVSNGDAAIKRFEEISPSVVLADIYMPGKNGYEVCEYVKQHPTFSSTPVILLAGAFDAVDENRAKEAGAAATITKPFEPGSLIDLVNSVLSNTPQADSPAEDSDLLGLEAIFVEEIPEPRPQATVSDEEIDRIAEQVLQRVTRQVIENIAWEIVPDMAEKVVREELKKSR